MFGLAPENIFYFPSQVFPHKWTGNTKLSTMAKARNCCFTKNNYDDATAYIDKLKAWKRVTYAKIGAETGESGTAHLQGYLEFNGVVEWSTIHKKLEQAHCEARRGTADQAADYCGKGSQSHDEWKAEGKEGPTYGTDAVVWEWGEMTQQGKRNDLSPACDMIKEGVPMREVAIEHPEVFVRFHKGLIALQSILIQPRNEVPDVTVLYGSTGTGKSREAREILEKPYVWHPQQSQWFDGYAGEKDVLFEEFRGQIPFGMLLSLLDRYDCKVQYKGGMCEFAATKIVLTSPIHPRDWYKVDELATHDKIEQLLRRINKIVDLDENAAKRRRLDDDRDAKIAIVGQAYNPNY